MKKLLGLSLLAACTSTTTSPDGGGGGGGGNGWTAMALLDDGSVQRSGNDLVTGIYFASADDGYVVTQGAGDSFDQGGAVYKTSATQVKSLAFSGKDGGPSLLGGVDFVGVDPTPNGIVAFAYSADIVASTDHGATFAIQKNGNLAGIEPALALRESSSGTTIVRDTGVVSTATTAPGPSASFTDVWAPNASPPIPEPVPTDECQDGPLGTGAPVTRASVYVSSDRQTIAYTADSGQQPQICLSSDGGHTFKPSILPSVPDGALDNAPTGIAYASATVAITWWGSKTASGAAYIERSTDGGKTWAPVALPASIASHAMALNAGFFAADGQHGWIVGYDDDASHALVLTTSDAGSTWATEALDSDSELYSVFALDATHVWVGGKAGTLLAHQ